MAPEKKDEKKDDKKKDEKVEVKTFEYKVHIHCGQCARDIQTQFTEFQGVEEVKVDAKAGKVTVKGFGVDEKKLKTKVEKACRKKVELLPPKEIKVVETKTKKEELNVITMSVPLHCPDCATRVKEILLEHKSIYSAKTDLGKNTCTIEGVIDEKKLTEYIYQRTRKGSKLVKIEKKVIIKEEKVEKKEEKKDDKKKDEKKDDKKKDEKKDEKKTEVVAPYFIPCTHPNFVDFSHPCHRRVGCYGCDCCSPCGGGGGGGWDYPYGLSYTYTTHSELKGYRDTAFLHCTHPHEFISEENPYACAVM